MHCNLVDWSFYGGGNGLAIEEVLGFVVGSGVDAVAVGDDVSATGTVSAICEMLRGRIVAHIAFPHSGFNAVHLIRDIDVAPVEGEALAD